jgi:hypothetical protein
MLGDVASNGGYGCSFSSHINRIAQKTILQVLAKISQKQLVLAKKRPKLINNAQKKAPFTKGALYTFDLKNYASASAELSIKTLPL